jgi:hypothetical protein
MLSSFFSTVWIMRTTSSRFETSARTAMERRPSSRIASATALASSSRLR